MRRLLKGLLPDAWRRWLFVLRQLQPAERRALLDYARRPPSDWRPVLQRARRVSVLCHGNIIRSPFGEAALARAARARALPLTVVSAGVGARNGEPADPRAVRSAQEFGLDLGAHRATFVDAAHLQVVDVLLVMDRLNLGRLLARFPEAKARTFLLGGMEADGRVTLAEIHDPVAGTADDVRTSHEEVLAAITRIMDAAFPPSAPAAVTARP
ncbi:MAG: hypothetical protein MUC69_09380 [Gemmatimonadales bacterium]|nr:hypothetical protein [Gemmatimonadales bacterium]